MNGTDNTLTLHGPRKDLHVNGARNRTTTDLVQSNIATGEASEPARTSQHTTATTSGDVSHRSLFSALVTTSAETSEHG